MAKIGKGRQVMTEQELNQVRELNVKIKTIENQLSILRKRAEDLVPKRDGLPHSSGIHSKVESLALKIVEASEGLPALHEQITQAAAVLTEKICREVDEPNQRTVLILRYVFCMNFRDISFQTGYSDRKVFALHHDALKILQLTCS